MSDSLMHHQQLSASVCVILRKQINTKLSENNPQRVNKQMSMLEEWKKGFFENKSHEIRINKWSLPIA